MEMGAQTPLGLVLRTRANLGRLPGLLRPQCWQEWQRQALSWASGSPRCRPGRRAPGCEDVGLVMAQTCPHR